MNKYYYSDGTLSEDLIHYKILHRLDGPAIEKDNGGKAWWINDKYLSEEQFEAHPLRIKYLAEKEIERLLNDTSR